MIICYKSLFIQDPAQKCVTHHRKWVKCVILMMVILKRLPRIYGS